MTVSDAFAHDIEAFLVADAVADFTQEHHRMALSYAAHRCAVALTTADVIDCLTGGAHPPSRSRRNRSQAAPNMALKS
jgi:isochorismate hydrolase